jgi:signal transduction histidine kinase
MAPSGRFVVIGFSLVGVGLIAATVWELSQTWVLQHATAEIVDNMLASIRLLGEVQTAIERRQHLIERHILANTTDEREEVEAQIEAVDRKVAAAIRAYEPWVTLPGERMTWERTRARLATLDEPISRAMALSRRNDDRAARSVMAGVESRFEQIDQDLDGLIAINNRGAHANLARYGEIQRQLISSLVIDGLASLLLTILAGVWAWKQVARREEEMTVAADSLRVQNRELDAFAGRVAHDIRGVLSSISVATTALCQAMPPDNRSAQILRRGATRMEALVDDLLSLARAEAAGFGQCDPAEVLAQVRHDLAPRLEPKSASIHVAVDHAEVGCHEGLLRQAVTNLIDNAIKYHREGVPPDVCVAGAAVDGRYDLRITDNGLGMSEEEIEKAFEPFYRSPRVRDLPGTGLGLSIVKRVVDTIGGIVSVQSRLGEGTTFVIRLQLAASRANEESQQSPRATL